MSLDGFLPSYQAICKDWPGLLVLPFPVPSAHFLGKEVRNYKKQISRNHKKQILDSIWLGSDLYSTI